MTLGFRGWRGEPRVAATGVIFSAVYMLWMYQRVFFGKITNAANESLADLTRREIAVIVPIVVFIVWIGVYPGTFLKPSTSASKQVVKLMQAAKAGELPKANFSIK